jgi:ankyrin repeat protein
MQALMAAGADENAASTAGFTALMWSASDPEKLPLLLSHHADVRARSKDGNTALILARQNAFTEFVRFCLPMKLPAKTAWTGSADRHWK